MTTQQPLSIVLERDDDVTVVRLAGELDVLTTGAFRAALDELLIDGPPRVLVDLSDLRFMDSSGLGVLVRAHRQARALQGKVAVVCRGGIVADLFRVTGLTHVLRIFSSVEDARAAM